MTDLSFDYQIDEFMVYCRSRELRMKTIESYEHTLRLFERWCNDELHITQVDEVTEGIIRRYITNLQERGKYTFYANEKAKETNFKNYLRRAGLSETLTPHCQRKFRTHYRDSR